MSTLLDLTLLQTKIAVPRVKNGSLYRPRLNRAIAQGSSGKLTSVCAPAGYGKTTLLSQWAGEFSGSTAWVSLDETDNDLGKFWRYAVHALAAKLPPGTLVRVQPLVHALPGLSVHTFLDALINELFSQREPVALILDDYQVITDERIHQSLVYFVEYLPLNVHVLIASRTDLPFPTSKWTAREEHTEIGAAQLRFTVEETESFCSRAADFSLSDTQINRLLERTEGWVTGLQLALISLRSHPNRDRFIEEFRGSNRSVSEFLFDEVFGKLPENIRDFLLRTSVLNRMDALLCDAVTGRTDSRTLLGTLQAFNLFVIPLDDEGVWFRYHHLFSQFLRALLQRDHPDAGLEAHRLASRSLAEQGYLAEAIDHALDAGDYASAERLLKRHIPAAFKQGEFPTLLRWFERLPQDAERQPDLILLYAYLLSAGGRPDRAEEVLRVVEGQFDAEPDEERRAQIRSGMLFVRSNLLFFRGQFDRWHSFAERNAERVLPSNRTFYSFNYNLTEPFVRRTALGLKGALNAHTEAIGLGFVNVLENQGWNDSYINLYVRQSMVEGYYEWNRLEDCRSCMQAVEPFVNRDPIPGLLIPLRIMQARLFLAQGQAHLAHETIDQAADYAETLAEPHWAQFLRAFKAIVHLAEEQPASARKLIAELGVSEKDKPTLSRELEYTALVRLLIKQKKFTPALRLLELLQLQSQRENLLSSMAEIAILQAVAEFNRGHRSAGLRHLHEALRIGEVNGYVRSFLDEGTIMAEMLQSYCVHRKCEAGSPEWQGASVTYAERLVGLFPAKDKDASRPASEDLVEPLNESEVAMLGLIRSGATNGKIAQSLALSEGTVKVYLSRLYAKLGVSSRTQAVNKAQELRVLE